MWQSNIFLQYIRVTFDQKYFSKYFDHHWYVYV